MSIGATATIVGTVLIIAIMVVAALSEHRKRGLRSSFGPEYDRLVQEKGSARAADHEILRRKQAHDRLTLAPVGPDELQYFRTAWDNVQGGFLDDPATSLTGAELLISSVLDARGYPGGDPEERLALLSVRHPRTLGSYRSAAQVVERVHGDPAAASTEDLRNALMQFHEIFDELLADAGAPADPRHRTIQNRTSQESEVRS